MKTFWKVLGAAALAIGLTPYKIEKNAETGENSYQSLLWRITSEPSKIEGEKREININLMEGTLTSKLLGEQKEEPHLFSDELCVEYTGTPVTTESAAPVEEEPAAPAEPSEPEEPAAPAPAEKPAEEEKA